MLIHVLLSIFGEKINKFLNQLYLFGKIQLKTW